MTVSEEFIPMAEEQADAPPPPGSYKIGNFVITPMHQGIALGVVGVAIAAFVAFKMVMPAFAESDRLKSEIATKQAEITKQKSAISQIDEAKANLESIKQQKENVLALFAQGTTLETLLLDINTIVKQSGATLESFKPVEKPPNEWIFEEGQPAAGAAPPAQQAPPEGQPAEGAAPAAPALTLSQALTGKTLALQMQGSYQNTLETLRKLEQLQQMVVVGEFTAQLADDSQKIFVNPDGKITEQAKPTLETVLNLIAVMPLPPEQLEQLAAPPPPPAEGEKVEGQ